MGTTSTAIWLPLLRLESGELALDAVHRIPRQDAGEIDDARGERRHRHEGLRERDTCRKAQERRGRGAPDALRGPCPLPGERVRGSAERAYCGGAAPAGGELGVGDVGGGVAGGGAEKSTAGGFEIAASFSTVKFGLVL